MIRQAFLRFFLPVMIAVLGCVAQTAYSVRTPSGVSSGGTDGIVLASGSGKVESKHASFCKFAGNLLRVGY